MFIHSAELEKRQQSEIKELHDLTSPFGQLHPEELFSTDHIIE
jgi:hypothetical protein